MREATTSHAADIAALDMELFPENCFNERTITKELLSGNGFVAYRNEELAGYILFRWDWELLDITRLGVKPTHQETGIGAQLLDKVLSTTRMDVMLCVSKTNTKAIKLYQSRNFKIAGQLKNSWVMRRTTSR